MECAMKLPGSCCRGDSEEDSERKIMMYSGSALNARDFYWFTNEICSLALPFQLAPFTAVLNHEIFKNKSHSGQIDQFSQHFMHTEFNGDEWWHDSVSDIPTARERKCFQM